MGTNLPHNDPQESPVTHLADGPSTASNGRPPAPAVSLEEVHGSVLVPHPSAGFWKNWKVYAGPALLVSVGYMDPGNWGTDLEAGAVHKYGLLWVVGLASMMAIFVQIAAARLGVVTGKDLAQACRDFYPAWTRWPNWLACELAIVACDLAEVLGSAVAINMLFGIPLLPAVVITAFDVLLLLGLQRVGIRKIEAFILVLVATIAVCYFIEIFVLPHTRPDFGEIGRALVTPQLRDTAMLFLAISIIGATVMPHNLYLHSALVQTRRFQKDEQSIRTAIKFNSLDSVISLSLAFLVNAAILVMAATTFYGREGLTLPNGDPIDDDWIRGAHWTLDPLLGTALASTLFAVALLASGQSSTITGTLAGQVAMEGFMHWRIRPWLRRLLTRSLAILPAILVIALQGDTSVNELLVISQMVLGLQLPFALIPLMLFTSSRRRMGQFTNPKWLLLLGWGSTLLITGLDVLYLVMRLAGLDA
jgi:manganese transport protein